MSDLDELARQIPSWTWAPHLDLPGAILGARRTATGRLLRLCLDRALPGHPWRAVIRDVSPGPLHTLATVDGADDERATSVAARAIAQMEQGGDR